MTWLAAYMRETFRRLAATDQSQLLQGRVDFPDPALFVAQSTMEAS
jgi:hypothetical protein